LFLVKHNGNVSFDSIIEIAREMQHRSLARDLAHCAREILGTCVSVGCTVNGKSPRDIIAELDDGKLECPAN